MIKDVIITFMGHILQIYVYSVHVFVFMISTNNECNMNKQLFSGNYVVTRKLMNTRGEYNVSHITENSNRKQLKPLSCFFTYIFALLCSLSTNDIRHFEKKTPFRIVADNYHLLHPNPRVSKFRKVRHGMAVDLTPPPPYSHFRQCYYSNKKKRCIPVFSFSFIQQINSKTRHKNYHA